MASMQTLHALVFGCVLFVCCYGDTCSEFGNDLRLLQEMLVEQNKTITKQSAEMASLKQELTALRGTRSSIGLRQAEGVAFTAYHDHEEQVHAGNPLKFNRVLYNVGHMYEPTTGIATIQASGTYLFTVTIEHWQSVELRCYLVVDGVNQVDVIIFPQGKSTQASNTAILGLQQGQKVWVKTDDGTVFGSDGFRGTTFAAAMIY